jgi:nucleotide-binding universal stress UspA family protein
MKNILVPTDFSENAGKAVEFAAVIAGSWNATLTLLSVYTPAVSRYNMISPLLVDEIAQAKKEILEKLQLTAGTVKEVYPGVTCHTTVGTGETVEGILEAVDAVKADLIIMGTQGASSIEKVLLGSNAADIIEKAECPVLVVPGGTEIHMPKNIVFATDYAYSDIEGARLLTSMARVFEATITFVHVTKNEEDIDDELKVIEKFTEEIKSATAYPNINFKILSDNTVFMGLDSIVENAATDLMALSTRRRSLFEKLYNPSLTKKLAQYTQIPLLAFKTHGDQRK